MKPPATGRWRINPKTRSWIVLAALAMAGTVMILFQTRFGPGTGGDSTSYLMGAENLLAGNGFSRFSGGYEIRPITGFPPFFSIVLAGIHAIGFSLIGAARWLNALLFGTNIFLVGALVFRRTSSWISAALASTLILFADELFLWHSWVMSEPLFIFITLVGIWLLVLQFRNRSLLKPVLVGLFFALATLTRYAGISLFAAGAFVFLVYGRNEWRSRLVDCATMLLAGLIVVGIWLARNASVAGTAVNREIIFHGIDRNLLRLNLAEISSWFVPHEVPLPTAVRAIIAIVLATVIFGVFYSKVYRSNQVQFRQMLIQERQGRDGVLPWLMLAFMVFYIGVLASNYLFLDASTSPQAVPRYLTPLYVALVIFAISEGNRVLSQIRKRSAKSLAIIIVVILFFVNASNTMKIISQPLLQLGYTGNRIQWSELVNTLEELDPDQPILSNNPELVYILVNRPAYVRPIRYDHYQERFREDFEGQLRWAEGELEKNGVLVVFKPVEDIDELVIEYTGVIQLAEFDAAVIYGYESALSGGRDARQIVSLTRTGFIR